MQNWQMQCVQHFLKSFFSSDFGGKQEYVSKRSSTYTVIPVVLRTREHSVPDPGLAVLQVDDTSTSQVGSALPAKVEGILPGMTASKDGYMRSFQSDVFQSDVSFFQKVSYTSYNIFFMCLRLSLSHLFSRMFWETNFADITGEQYLLIYVWATVWSKKVKLKVRSISIWNNVICVCKEI